jgi:branched-chain amino acid transport system ATP-binding protein
MTASIELSELTAGYGSVPAVHGITMAVPKGQTIAVLGPNGAGKTTLLKAVVGLVSLHSGSIRVNGQDLSENRSAERMASRGIQYVAEGHRVFEGLSVGANLLFSAESAGIPRRERRGSVERVLEHFPELRLALGSMAGSLSGGQQQMLAIAQALAAEPSVMLIDEPSLGLAPIMIDRVFDTLRRLKERGLTVVIVEQVVQRAADLADYVYVLRGGRIAAEGLPSTLRTGSALEHAYFGNANGRPPT